jgi:hypothetical protein
MRDGRIEVSIPPSDVLVIHPNWSRRTRRRHLRICPRCCLSCSTSAPKQKFKLVLHFALGTFDPVSHSPLEVKKLAGECCSGSPVLPAQSFGQLTLATLIIEPPPSYGLERILDLHYASVVQR